MADNPLLGSLSKGALAALPYLTGLVNEGKQTATQMLASVRAAGFSIRTQTLFDVVRVLQDNVNAATALRLTPPDQPIDPRTYGIGPVNQRRSFNYQVLLRTTDVSTGEVINQHVTVASNVALSTNTILSMAQGYGVSGKYGDSISVDEMRIVSALKSPDYEG